jgi:hypothetical protein
MGDVQCEMSAAAALKASSDGSIGEGSWNGERGRGDTVDMMGVGELPRGQQDQQGRHIQPSQQGQQGVSPQAERPEFVPPPLPSLEELLGKYDVFYYNLMTCNRYNEWE